MKPLKVKPKRAVGIVIVIAIALVLISGLPPSQDSSRDSALEWETGIQGTEVGARDTNVVDVDDDGRQRFALGGFGLLSDRLW